MSASETQARLLGGPSGDSASITTSGRLIRPALEIPTSIVDELKAHFTPNGANIRAVDPSNVSLCQLNIEAGAFEDYDIKADDELVVGFNITGLADNLSHARLGKRTDDPVRLDIDETRTIIEVEREYETADVHYADEQLNIDPDAIRQEPDLPDLDLSAKADVGVDAFVDAIKHLKTTNDYVNFQVRDGSLIVTGEGNEDSPVDYSSAVEFSDVASLDEEAETDHAFAKYSMSYLISIAKALKSAKIDSLSMAWGEEMPAYLEFERQMDDTVAYSGQFMLAPRIGGAD